MLAAVAEEGFRVFDATQAAALIQAPPDPVEQLQALGVAYVRFALDRPHYFRVMFRPHLVEHAKYPRLHDISRRAFERLVDCTRAARLTHGHDDPDPLLTATVMWSVPHGLAMLYLEGPLSTTTTPRMLEELTRAATVPLAAASMEELQRGDAQWGV